MTCVAQHTLNGVSHQGKDIRRLNGIHQFSTPELSLCLPGSTSTPSKMRFSDAASSDFDISSILARVSGHESNDVSAANDGLFNLLDKISTTGQQLRDELQNAKLREDSLVKEMHQLRARENESLQLSPIKASPCSQCNGGFLPLSNGDTAIEVNEKCEKLQNALLSLEEENMRLNRLLKQMPSPQTNGTLAIAGESISPVSSEILKSREKEIEALRDQVGELQKLLTEARDEVVKEKQLKADFLKKASSQNKVSVALNTSVSEDQLLQLQQKANLLQKQNADYLERIKNLETKLKLSLESASVEETYKLRIDDLHNLLVLKEGEISKLQDSLSFMTKDLADKDKKAKAAQSKDICKRKEVLLLCDKYEQLKKSVKRLESDLHDSQQKLQEANTKCWALETSFQRTVEENEVLKHQLGLFEGFMMNVKSSKNTSPLDAANLVKDYERLTGKYEELLSLRLREFDKLKSSSRNRKLLRKISAHYQAEEYDKRRHIRKALFSDSDRDQEMMEELMWRRERDMRRFNAQVDNPTVRSQSAQELKYPPDRPTDQQFEKPYPTEMNYYKPRNDIQGEPHQVVSQTAAPVPSTNPAMQHLPMDYYPPKESYTRNIDCLLNDPTTNLRTGGMTSTPTRKPSPAPYIPSHEIPSHSELPTRPSCDDFQLRTRSKSASPVRTSLDDKMNDSQNSSGKDSQKSVSFCLSPNPERRSSSARGSDVSRCGINLTPRGNPLIKPKQKAISPVEVLERVKSAYQEEYIRNMDGVGVSFASSRATQADLKASPSQPSDAASLYGQRYETMSQNLKQFVEKSYSSSSSLPYPTKQFNYYRPQRTRPKSPSPKSILKKPKTTEYDVGRRTPSPLTQPDSHRNRVVVREKTPSHALEYTPNKDSSLSRMDEEKCTYSPVEIIDVNPMPIDRDGNHLSFNSSAESLTSTTQSEGTKEDPKIKVDDLTAPIQFTKLHKEGEDDSDTVSQSSVSSTTEHIGRFEFLQEMRSTLKSPKFAYQKPPRKQPPLEEIGTKVDKNTSGDLGLSARQQEYANKLIEKYTKVHSKGENRKNFSHAVIRD